MLFRSWLQAFNFHWNWCVVMGGTLFQASVYTCVFIWRLEINLVLETTCVSRFLINTRAWKMCCFWHTMSKLFLTEDKLTCAHSLFKINILMFCSFLAFIIYCWKEIIYFENLGSSLEFLSKFIDSITKSQNPISMWTFWFNNCMNAFYPFGLFM